MYAVCPLLNKVVKDTVMVNIRDLMGTVKLS